MGAGNKWRKPKMEEVVRPFVLRYIEDCRVSGKKLTSDGAWKFSIETGKSYSGIASVFRIEINKMVDTGEVFQLCFGQYKFQNKIPDKE